MNFLSVFPLSNETISCSFDCSRVTTKYKKAAERTFLQYGNAYLFRPPNSIYIAKEEI